MSDRAPVDLMNLEEAFAHLTADIDARTRARGADRAIRRAGRRRLHAAGAALAIVVLLAGALVGTLGLPGTQSVPPAAVPMPDPLPDPRAFDAAAFTEATDGWTRAWTKGASSVSTELPCVTEGTTHEPLNSTTTEFRAGARIGATHQVLRFTTTEQAADAMVWHSWLSCKEEEILELPDEIWVGGQSVAFGGETAPSRFVYKIIVLHETELAVVRIAAVGELPEEVRQRIVYALLADLRT